MIFCRFLECGYDEMGKFNSNSIVYITLRFEFLLMDTIHMQVVLKIE